MVVLEAAKDTIEVGEQGEPHTTRAFVGCCSWSIVTHCSILRVAPHIHYASSYIH